MSIVETLWSIFVAFLLVAYLILLFQVISVQVISDLIRHRELAGWPKAIRPIGLLGAWPCEATSRRSGPSRQQGSLNVFRRPARMPPIIEAAASLLDRRLINQNEFERLKSISLA